MRKRIIDTELLFYDTEIINLLTPLGILLYIRLWGIAEDWGGFEFNAKQIKLRMGAINITNKEVETELNKLVNSKKIIIYNINGKSYGWLRNLLNYQDLRNASAPRLPLPEWVTFELKEYPSGKKYAIYQIIAEKLPVTYQNATNNLPVIQKPIETYRNHRNKEKFLDFVLLTPEEYAKLCDKFSKEGADKRIFHLNNYIGAKGRQYKSHYHTILMWEKERPAPPKTRSDERVFGCGNNT